MNANFFQQVFNYLESKMSYNDIETIAIKTEPTDQNPSGKVIINKVDFDSKVHTLFEELVEEVEQVIQKVETTVSDAVQKVEDAIVAPWAKKE
jgi:hypothetical protein